jgi:hypothetical protein
MATLEWHWYLVEQIPMAPAVAAKLSHQLVSQARALAGITLDDGDYLLAPAGHAFTVQYSRVDGVTIATIDADLVGLDATGHQAVLAWRSTAGADLELTPDRGASDLEFFWLTFPAAELAHPIRIDTGEWLVRNRFGFDVDLELYSLPDIWLRFTARTAFTPEEVTDISAAIGAGIAAWNMRGQTFVHYCSKPEIPADHRTVANHIDLGSAQLDGLAEIIRAVDASSAGAAVGRCYVGRLRKEQATARRAQ